MSNEQRGLKWPLCPNKKTGVTRSEPSERRGWQGAEPESPLKGRQGRAPAAKWHPAQQPGTPPGLLFFFFKKIFPPPLFPQPGLWERTKGAMEFPSKATGHMVKRSGPLGPCFLKVARLPRQSGSSGVGVGGGVPWPRTPQMSDAKQQELSLREAGQRPPSGLYARALGGGESAEIPACVLGQGHRQAVAICCRPERPGQGPSTLEDNPSLSPNLLMFAETFMVTTRSYPHSLPARYSHSPHSTEEEVEAQRGLVVLPRVLIPSRRESWDAEHSASPSLPQPWPRYLGTKHMALSVLSSQAQLKSRPAFSPPLPGRLLGLTNPWKSLRC